MRNLTEISDFTQDGSDIIRLFGLHHVSSMSELSEDKMRVNPWGRAGGRWALGVAMCAFVVVGAFSMTGHARQARSVADGVYTTEQAQRGAELYKAQCVACHGAKLEGLVGPMLAKVKEVIPSYTGTPTKDPGRVLQLDVEPRKPLATAPANGASANVAVDRPHLEQGA